MDGSFFYGNEGEREAMTETEQNPRAEEKETAPDANQETAADVAVEDGAAARESAPQTGKTARLRKKGKKGRAAKPEEKKKDEREGAPDDRLIRLQADFDNFRKRVLREKDELYRRANEDLLEELLPVLDHMELALKAAVDHDAPDPMIQGFRLVHEQFQTALRKFGLQPIVAEGQPFDPNLHEAVSHLPSEELPEGHVMVDTRRGYLLGDRLLRASQVVVSAGPQQEAE